jgi:hypothetical protein
MNRLFFAFFVMVLCLESHAQPNGYEYVIQTDFGDAQDTIYPNATGQWVQTPWWKNVQPLGVQTNWYGPKYMPLGASSHGKYVMLDDDQYDYGAIAGNIHDLEYRLVQCDFDYHLYDPTTTSGFLDGGTLYVLLTESDVDVRSFDADHPEDFEANGYGQVLFALDIPGGSPTSLTDPWYKLSGQNTQSTAYRTAYALSKSATGTPGRPFTYVGLVWRSRDPFAERILIDDFHLVDVCPDCQMDLQGYVSAGCFDHTWVSSVRNNYYYYTASVVDSATLAPIYQVLHQPARFSWNGVGNQGVWNGVLVPYGHPMKALIRYYSCLRTQANVVALNYLPTRVSGCVDQDFGGSKTAIYAQNLTVRPNPVATGTSLHFEIHGIQPRELIASLRDLAGKELKGWMLRGLSATDIGYELLLPNVPSGTYQFVVWSDNQVFQRLIFILP